MSRYEIPARRPALECEVGWDPPLATFFAQVYDHDGPDPYGDGGLMVWFGTSYAEIPKAEELIARLERWVEVDPQTVATLEADKAGDPAWPRRVDIELFVESMRLPSHFKAGMRIYPPEPADVPLFDL